MKKFQLFVAAAILFPLMVLGGCAQFEKAKQSDEFAKFCVWAPVALVGIEGAEVEMRKDPAKLGVAEAVHEALGYFRLIAGQCPPAPLVPAPPVK